MKPAVYGALNALFWLHEKEMLAQRSVREGGVVMSGKFATMLISDLISEANDDRRKRDLYRVRWLLGGMLLEFAEGGALAHESQLALVLMLVSRAPLAILESAWFKAQVARLRPPEFGLEQSAIILCDFEAKAEVTRGELKSCAGESLVIVCDRETKGRLRELGVVGRIETAVEHAGNAEDDQVRLLINFDCPSVDDYARRLSRLARDGGSRCVTFVDPEDATSARFLVRALVEAEQPVSAELSALSQRLTGLTC
jgi:hypothetical protein